MTRPPQLLALSVKKRHPRWIAYYPANSWDWRPWHMSLIGHGMPPVEKPTTFMSGLYQTNTQRSPAALDLLSFEARTPILHLPGQTGVTESLLVPFAEELERRASPIPFWTTLSDHYTRHGQSSAELPHLQAASEACMRYLSQLTGRPRIDPDLAKFDPGQVTSPLEYAQLARLITLLAVSAERPFRFTLHCPRGDFKPYVGLGLNIYVPQEFLSNQGVLATREVMVGITLGIADLVTGPPNNLYVPRFLQEQYFATMYAPTNAQSSAMYANGRSCSLIL